MHSCIVYVTLDKEVTWLNKVCQSIVDTFTILEEIIACFLSLFSALTLDAPRVSRRQTNDTTSSTREDMIHREYVSFDEDNLPSETEYVQIGYELRSKPSYIQSLLRSLKANFTITLDVLPLALIGIAYIF
ncbi:Hypothetical predicted protein [Paramuricea clavata]|uniref:Uncharacterized protein n=1 Tax=Paramuricea clavata TaxID=317549 RepID=A0A7D9DMK5_PARCT|nr:Hypothetical predicted protein [Paramuricea clavata]